MTIKIQTIIGLALALVGCATPFEPTPAGNPWPDDYTNLASMENYQKWGTYNVHDPSCRRVGNQYYMYSTDAIFAENRLAAQESGVPIGYIQMRRSSDLVNWEFVGWAFDSIPSEAVDWVRSNAGGHGATNIWAPYMIEHNGRYRLYYSVSAFGRKDSYIGLAESESPTDRKSTRLNSSHQIISYAAVCLKKKTPAAATACRCASGCDAVNASGGGSRM